MTKNTLIDQVSEATQSTKKDAELVVDVCSTALPTRLQRARRLTFAASAVFKLLGRKNVRAETPGLERP
jgi:nucleoid DNA-binding protein